MAVFQSATFCCVVVEMLSFQVAEDSCKVREFRSALFSCHIQSPMSVKPSESAIPFLLQDSASHLSGKLGKDDRCSHSPQHLRSGSSSVPGTGVGFRCKHVRGSFRCRCIDYRSRGVGFLSSGSFQPRAAFDVDLSGTRGGRPRNPAGRAGAARFPCFFGCPRAMNHL